MGFNRCTLLYLKNRVSKVSFPQTRTYRPRRKVPTWPHFSFETRPYTRVNFDIPKKVRVNNSLKLITPTS